MSSSVWEEAVAVGVAVLEENGEDDGDGEPAAEDADDTSGSGAAPAADVVSDAILLLPSKGEDAVVVSFLGVVTVSEGFCRASSIKAKWLRSRCLRNVLGFDRFVVQKRKTGNQGSRFQSRYYQYDRGVVFQQGTQEH